MVDRLENICLCALRETVVVAVCRSVVAGVRHVVAFLKKKRKVKTGWNGRVDVREPVASSTECNRDLIRGGMIV